VTSLTDKLKALGVKVGANDLPAPQPALSSNSLLEQVLGGHTWPTHLGETYAVEAHYPVGQSDIHTSLELSAPLQVLAEWAGDARIQAMPVAAFAFLDTETTGLSGGTGTYPFLVGVGRFEHGETGDEFHLAQFFLRDPLEEPAQLAALEEFLAPCQAIVTFNGKAFDAPLLNTRYTVHGWRAPLADLAHIDLLHLARRLWHDRIPSRTLSNLEYQILGTARSEQDIPGWDIPRIYRQYLNSGDPGELRRVFYHNAMDVISLAALMNHMASLLANPLELGNQHGVDLIALARLFEDLGQIEAAAALYVHGLGHEDALTQRMPRPVLLQAIGRLALIHKRRGEWEKAIQLWQQAAYHQHLDAFIELAKCHEHIFKDYPAATRWTQAAADLVNSPNAQTGSGTILTPYERRQWLADLQHRLDRLQKLASRSQSRPQSPAP
jgi:hypothetical protein